MMASASAIDAIDQLLDGRHVVDQAHDHAAAPGTGIHIAVDHDLGIDARDLVEDVVDLRHLAVLALLREQPFDALLFSTRSVLRSARITSRVSSSDALTIVCLTLSCAWGSPRLVPSPPVVRHSPRPEPTFQIP